MMSRILSGKFRIRNTLLRKFSILSRNTVHIITFLLIVNNSLIAQYQNIRFQNLTIDEGLLNNICQCIFQDKDSWIWIGTSDGLIRYDGYKFREYRHDILDTTSLQGILVRDILQDSDGHIWIGTELGGLNLYNPGTDDFTAYVSSAADSNSLSDNSVNAIMEDEQKKLWIGTENGLNILDPSSGIFKRFYHNPLDSSSLIGNSINCLFRDSKNRIWIGTDIGLDLYNRDSNTFHHFFHYFNKDMDVRINEVRTIYEDSENNIWIGTYMGGLHRVDVGNGRLIQFIPEVEDSRSYSVRAIREDRYGNLWLGTRGGLYICDKKGELLVKKVHNPFDNSTLVHNSILTFFKDHEGNIWIGTRGGISYMEQNFLSIIHYKSIPENRQYLNNSEIWAIYEDTEGNLWIGTEEGGVNYLDKSSGRFSYLTSGQGKNKISSNHIKAIHQVDKDHMLFGTYNDGLNMYNKKTGIFVRYLHDPENNHSICDNIIWDIFEDKDHHIWIATSNGVDIYNPANGRFIHYKDTLKTSSVLSIYQDSDGILYFMNELKQLICYDPAKGKTYNFDYAVSIMLQDSKGNYWLGTKGSGLYKLNPDFELIKKYTIKEGLPNNNIQGILEDKSGNLWLSTLSGLSTMDLESELFINYSKYDGFQSNQFNRGAYYQSSNGQMFFGGNNGFNVFHPDSIYRQNIPDQIVLTDIKINNKSLRSKESVYSKPDKKIEWSDNTIRLPYDYGIISIEFSAFDFLITRNIYYEVRLKGAKHDWSYVGNQPFANYFKLPPDNYTFTVKASKNNYNWTEQQAQLNLIVIPPFWQTWWFKSIIISFTVILLFLIYYLKVSQIRRRNIILGRLVKERTKEINEKNTILVQQTEELNSTNTLLEERQQQIEEQTDELKAQRDQLSEVNSVKDKLFSIIAHDLRSPFNTLKGFTDLIKSRYDDYSDEERKNMISIISDSAGNVYNLLDNLLNWSRSQRGAIHFVPEMTNIIGIVRENINLFKGQAANKNIKIESTTDDKEIRLMIDKEMINMVIRNLLANAIKYTNVDGKIELNCMRENNNVIISVKDNGIGIPGENKEKLFRNDVHFTSRGTKNETGTGLGLLLCKELIEKHKGKIWIESELNKGTEIFVSLPVNIPGTDLKR